MLPAFDEQHVSKSVSFEKEKAYASKAIRKETKEDMIKRLNMDLDNDKLKNDSNRLVTIIYMTRLLKPAR